MECSQIPEPVPCCCSRSDHLPELPVMNLKVTSSCKLTVNHFKVISPCEFIVINLKVTTPCALTVIHVKVTSICEHIVINTWTSHYYVNLLLSLEGHIAMWTYCYQPEGYITVWTYCYQLDDHIRQRHLNSNGWKRTQKINCKTHPSPNTLNTNIQIFKESISVKQRSGLWIKENAHVCTCVRARMCVCVCMRACVCACAWEKVRERKRQREDWATKYGREKQGCTSTETWNLNQF